MNPNPGRPSPTRRSLLVGTALLMGVAWGAPSPADAQNCLGDVSPANSCTANDMNLANARAGEIFDPQGDFANCPAGCADSDSGTACVVDRQTYPSCDFGCTGEDDTVTFELLVDVQNSGGNQRYDVGVFVAADGGDAFSGTCEVAVIPSTNPAFQNLEGSNADACGDIQVDQIVTVSVGVLENVSCTDADPLGVEDGKLSINGCVSWDNNTQDFCADAGDAIAGTPSKCDCSPFTVAEIVIPPAFCETPDACDDGNPCTNDTCDPTNGDCTFTPVVCDDGSACTNDSCDPQSGDCSFTAVDCSDGDACTADQCDPATGCSNPDVTAECDDDDACTVDSCDPSEGCVSAPVVCDDANACTSDSCDPQTGCTQETIDCDDQNACTIDTCDPVTGCTHEAVVCDDGSACTEDSCDPNSGCVNAVISCDDQSACTTDSCDPASGCVNAAVNCDDQNACTTDSCDPATGCGYVAVGCDDGNACTTDSCDPATGCGYEPVSCDDSNACTVDSCDRATGCGYEPVSCDDGNACTTDSCDPATGCGYEPVSCDDGNACTTDSCDSATGCGYEALSCDDENLCTADSCDATSGCVNTDVTAECDDQIACTDDGCDPQAGCTSVFDPENEDGTCVLEVCRTAGFWSTHGEATAEVLSTAGCLSICGETIDDVTVGSADSALEATCVSPNGEPRLQLIRQLTATALNCVLSRGVPGDPAADCGDASIEAVFAACDAACQDPNAPATAIGECVAELDCFNNGGIYEAGTCRLGDCSSSGEPCGTGFPACAEGETCDPLVTNCHEQLLENPDLGLSLEGSPTSSKECNSATKNQCIVVPSTTKKGASESRCTAGNDPEESCAIGGDS